MVNIDKPILIAKERIFLPSNFILKEWEGLKPYFDNLLEREINSADALQIWLNHWNELDAYISENFAWRYIKNTCNTEDEALKSDYLKFINEIKPKIAPINNELQKKLLNAPYIDTLNSPRDKIFIRGLKKDIAIFREENIELISQIEELSQQYADIVSQMMIQYNGEEITLSQAAKYLKSADRNIRKEVYELICNRRLTEKDKLDEIFNKQVTLRNQVALNAGFSSFADYVFTSFGRFDYNQEDVTNFHKSVSGLLTPLVEKLYEEKLTDLSLPQLKPYDVDAEKEGLKPLFPYKTSEEMIDKTILALSKLHPVLGECIQTMKDMGYLDLDARKGKAPGGYNYPLDEIGIPFIFMNSSGKHRDLVTMFHECGHAIHSFLTRDLPLNVYKHTPSEVAELASMSMELLSMDYWDIFYPNPEDVKRAKKEQLEGIIEILPWIALIDNFQKWIYENPNHTVNDRKAQWNSLYANYYPSNIDWVGYEEVRSYLWQKQLHIFEVPFYYIEYGIAQLGAIAVWKNYKENKVLGLKNYIEALKLGYTQTVPQIYQTAGIKFDFSKEYINELVQFIRQELNQLSQN